MTGAAQRVQALLDVGRFADATAAAREALRHDPEDWYLQCLLANALLEDSPAEALAVAGRAVALAPEDEWPWRLQAFGLLALGRPRDAERAAAEAVRLDPLSSSAHIALAEAIRSAGGHVRALGPANRARELAPQDPAPHVLLGNLALASDSPMLAERHYRRALELDPEEPVALFNLGLARQRLGDHPGARTAYERAGRIDVRSSDARERLTESARASVNGFAACFACWILAAATVVAFATDEPFAGIVLGGALVVAVALLVVWTRRRAARLTPAARALLRDQPWHRKLRIAGLPGAYWTLPAPLLLGVFSVMLVFSVFEGFDAGWDWPALITTGALASLVALTGRASLIVAEQMGAER